MMTNVRFAWSVSYILLSVNPAIVTCILLKHLPTIERWQDVAMNSAQVRSSAVWAMEKWFSWLCRLPERSHPSKRRAGGVSLSHWLHVCNWTDIYSVTRMGHNVGRYYHNAVIVYLPFLRSIMPCTHRPEAYIFRIDLWAFAGRNWQDYALPSNTCRRTTALQTRKARRNFE